MLQSYQRVPIFLVSGVTVGQAALLRTIFRQSQLQGRTCSGDSGACLVLAQHCVVGDRLGETGSARDSAGTLARVSGDLVILTSANKIQCKCL